MKFRTIPIHVFALAVCFPVVVASAAENGHQTTIEESGPSASSMELDTIEDLKAEVRALREAVRALQATQPTITALMPDFAERFHVMHYAGDAEDWAVATHELLEMQRMVEVIKRVNPEDGRMMEGFLSQSFDELNTAIEHGDRDAFSKALSGTVDQCNACHVAAGSPFIEVTLDVDESLSMRHPHRLQQSDKPGAHMHTH